MPYNLIKAEYNKKQHMGNACTPIVESLIIRRRPRNIHSWRNMHNPPSYFHRVEIDLGFAYREDGSLSSFERYVTRRALDSSIRDFICNFIVRKRESKEIFNNFKRRTAVAATAADDYKSSVGFWYAGPAADFLTRQLSSRHTTTKIVDQDMLMKKVFNLSPNAIRRVLNGESTLFIEVSALCSFWRRKRTSMAAAPETLPNLDHIPEETRSDAVFVTSDEEFYDMKEGVYFVPSTGTVYKFLTRPSQYYSFVSEVMIGTSSRNIKGITSILSVCPSAQCFEMPFEGPSIDQVLHGDVTTLNDCGDEVKERNLYSAIMLQRTNSIPSDFSVKGEIVDSYTATLLMSLLRRRLLKTLPFFLAELCNTLTRLRQQGVCNADIKCDNFSVEGMTGAPVMIDLNLVLPVNIATSVAVLPDRNQRDSINPQMFARHPHIPPEFLNGESVSINSMSFGTAHMLRHILHILSAETGDSNAVSLHTNIALSEWISRGYNEDEANRPPIHEVATIIGAAFPLPNHVSALFTPKHTLPPREINNL